MKPVPINRLAFLAWSGGILAGLAVGISVGVALADAGRGDGWDSIGLQLGLAFVATTIWIVFRLMLIRFKREHGLYPAAPPPPV